MTANAATANSAKSVEDAEPEPMSMMETTLAKNHPAPMHPEALNSENVYEE